MSNIDSVGPRAIVLLIAASILCCGKPKRMFSAETGIITMDTDTAMSSADFGRVRMKAYFKDHGAIKAVFTMIDRPDLKETNVVIERNGYQTVYYLPWKTGKRSRISQRRLDAPAESLPGLPGLANYEVGGYLHRLGYRAEPIESRNLAGRETPGYAINTPAEEVIQRIWSWENIGLRWEIIGFSAMQATSVELDIPIPAEMFEVPADVVITSE